MGNVQISNQFTIRDWKPKEILRCLCDVDIPTLLKIAPVIAD